MQKRAERAVDQGGGFVQGEVAHVALAQIEIRSCLCGTNSGLCEHRR